MISIIVAFHNKEKTIVSVLESITAQSAQKFEVVILDNASEDGSEHQVRSYLIDRRMRYVRLDERVTDGEARRKALSLATGEWVLYLDGEITLEPDALQALYLTAKKYGRPVAVGQHVVNGAVGKHVVERPLVADGAALISRSIADAPSEWSDAEIAYTEHVVAVHGQLLTDKEQPSAVKYEKLFTPLQHDGIKVEHLNVHIGEAHILKDVSVEIPKNKITCIIGPSGCGKSTLLRTFNRIIDTTEGVKIDGDIWLGEKNIVKAHGAEKINLRRHIGLVPQRPCPLPMSIFDNVAYGLKIHGISKKSKQKEVVEHYLRSIGLWNEVKDCLSSPAARLSGGQQQRLCLARSLAVEPTVLLADESTSALDPISSKKVEGLFVDLKHDYTIVMVTHTLQQALRVADYVVFMYLGEVIEAGPAKQVFNNSQNELTRKYLDGAFS